MPKLIVPNLAIYVHFPWCVRKCPYCDFNSHQIDGQVPESRYLNALLRDLEVQAPRVVGRTVQSVFLGGGTPSLFSPDAIGRLMGEIRSKLDCTPDMEVTLEANPGTIEHGRFTDYRAAGVNRVSLGGQSFNERHLQALGRIHSGVETRTAAEELHAAGLHNFNIDLMYALPGQSVTEAETDVREALALEPAHLSHYQLTLEPGTVFYHRPPELPDDDSSWEMQVRCQALLAEKGFPQYEVSAYAPAGRRCRHNLNYWKFGDYLGLGAGAHGKLTCTDSDGKITCADAHGNTLEGEAIYRTAHPKQPRRYMEGDAWETRAIPLEERPFEFMLNALRLIEGFARSEFEGRTGLGLDGLQLQLQTAAQKGFLESPSADHWRPTSFGLKFLNELQMLFLDAPASPKRHKAATIP